MISGLEAGIGPRQLTRAAQWIFGIPIVFSFTNSLLGIGLPDPVMYLMTYVLPDPWHCRFVLLLVAAAIEISDMALMQGEKDYETRVHELVKSIGDRLRAGAAVETAVAEACRDTDGPSEVFADAIERSDAMPFDLALREAADECGSAYLQEVCYLIAEAVRAEGDIGGAIRRLGMELERNHQYQEKVNAKIANPLMVLRAVGLFAVPPLYGILRWSFNNFTGGGLKLEPGAMLFFLYGALAITVYDGLIFGQWERLFARMPLAVAAVYVGLHTPHLIGSLF
ncbi:MAG: type II secretion system F family protein [Alphaproteobacteria bacterium]|nr:type II secretion system F family protein [Alphaproteobacteria bacterium]